jgi:3-hydroxymyristoyl/3-hydroxydecanoyl-(acyl carrier protein) dehydratase
LPDGKMNLVHRVTMLDPEGGDYGLGLITAEADVHPGDWFLVCHFVDDQVMPGTLMYECCLHTLRVFLYRLGWVGERDDIVCQPVVGIASQLKCRGQVLESTKVVTYEVHIKEIGYEPEPYAVADALMYADQKRIVDISNMCIRFSGLDEKRLQRIWPREQIPVVKAEGSWTPCPEEPHFGYERLLAFALGKPSEAFGAAYRPFDSDRKIARFPNPPFLLMDRVVHTDAAAFTLTEGACATVEYDVPRDAWFFAENRTRTMPYSILLEIALQSCGWLAAYMGSALHGNQDLLFRNLGGNAVRLMPFTHAMGVLRTRALPNFSVNPSVALKTPPYSAISCPMNTKFGCVSNAKLSAS